ncbi:unnamed protein product [Owenia fusiformis]|uniref:Uncharacterized protein n=1 Tax=Owenia fusiformis TaxID=6347 RepID=A0A8S4N3P2_OWEFU|nr:unnamed protein product [Owenia fusiformis]
MSYSSSATELTNGVEGAVHCGSGMKRRRTEDSDCNDNEVYVKQGRNFLTILGNSHTFLSEQWKPDLCTLYKPLTEDIMINMRNIEQVTFSTGSHFLADVGGSYDRSQQGCSINMWRYDPNQKHLYIAKSLFFNNAQLYDAVRRCLAGL